MLLDAQLLFSDAQAVTVDAATTNYIDLGIARNLFDGKTMAVVMTVDVSADHTTGDETYSFQIQTDDNTSFSSATALVTQTIAFSGLTAGTRVIFPVPVGQLVERYLRMFYDTGGTTPTITVTAFLMPLDMVQKDKIYAKGYTIS